MARQRITNHKELDVYKLAFESAMQVFEISKSFPKEETYALTDQIRRSSRSVCGNIAEAWRRRCYEAAFINCLNIAEAEAAETQTWLDFAVKCNYLPGDSDKELS
ncbi:MAG: four helix bundle protein [Anaerolineales bacterium]|nr:four helix bundle protein [Anaerolineales bacterium]